MLTLGPQCVPVSSSGFFALLIIKKNKNSLTSFCIITVRGKILGKIISKLSPKTGRFLFLIHNFLSYGSH